jgi:hypothetical protein
MSERQPFLRRAGEGESVWSLGGRFTIKLADASADGRLFGGGPGVSVD